MKELTVIGRAERVALPDLDLKNVPAKIDTGADISSVWASKVVEKDGVLECVFFGPGSPHYTGEVKTFPRSAYSITRIANSFGQREIRYKLKLRILVNGRLIKATFSLSNRSGKVYPILLGRRLLAGKFIVDVKQGHPLVRQEKIRKEKLKNSLDKLTNRNKS